MPTSYRDVQYFDCAEITYCDWFCVSRLGNKQTDWGIPATTSTFSNDDQMCKL